MPIDSYSLGQEPGLFPWSLDATDIVKKIEGHKIDHSKDDMRCMPCRNEGPFDEKHIKACWEGVCTCKCRRL